MRYPSEPLSPMESADLESPSQDTTARYVTDQEIRAKGYTIKSRPENGPPTWERSGIEFSESSVILREKLDR